MLPFVDTHCHLDFRVFDEDRPAVLDRARQAGLRRLVIPGIDQETSQAAIRLAGQHLDVRAAVGVHPNDAFLWKEGTQEQFADLARRPGVVAIGEIGLDYYRDRVTPTVQRHVLEEQLGLAANLSLPVILHNRQASEDLLAIITNWSGGLAQSGSRLADHPGVLHAFEGDLDLAWKIIGLGFKIGIGGPLTFKNARQRQEVAAKLPLSSLVLETDAPFLAPHPHRGQRNEPAWIPLIAEKIAALHGLPVDVIMKETTRNAFQLFALGDDD